jgi:hypothetical protein
MLLLVLHSDLDTQIHIAILGHLFYQQHNYQEDPQDMDAGILQGADNNHR